MADFMVSSEQHATVHKPILHVFVATTLSLTSEKCLVQLVLYL